MSKLLKTLVLLITLSLTACMSESDVLAEFTGGKVTRGDLRNYLEIQGKESKGAFLSAKVQSQLLRRLTLFNLAAQQVEKKGLTKGKKYKDYKLQASLTTDRNFLMAREKNLLRNEGFDVYQLQILFKRFPKTCYRKNLIGEVNLGDLPKALRIQNKKAAPLLKEGKKKSGLITNVYNNQKVTVLGKSDKMATVEGEKGYFYKVRIDSESSKYKASLNKKGKSKLQPSKGKVGFLFGKFIAYAVDDKGKEKCQAKFRKESEKILDEMKGLKGSELNAFIAKNTDEKPAMVFGGIKPYQAEVESYLHGYENLVHIKGKNKGEFAEKPLEMPAGMRFIYVRDKRNIEFGDIDDLMEEHFSSMTGVVTEVTEKQPELQKRAKRALKRDPIKQAKSYAKRMKSNLLKAAAPKLFNELKKEDGNKFNDEVDITKPDDVVVSTSTKKLLVKDLPKLFGQLVQKDWEEQKPGSQRQFAISIGQHYLCTDKVSRLEMSEAEKKKYDSFQKILLNSAKLNYYVQTSTPLESMTIDIKNVEQEYNKRKNKTYKGKTFADVKDDIENKLKKKKRKAEAQKLQNDLYKEGNGKINSEALRNGEV